MILFQSARANLSEISRAENISRIPPFQSIELVNALGAMKNGKDDDQTGVVADMVKAGSWKLRSTFIDFFNYIIAHSCPPSSCSEIHFSMLPKGGALSDIGNWRPIAKLSRLYKIFSSMIYTRLESLINNFSSKIIN